MIYDQEIAPMALIECKSGRIKLNAKTAEQAARYNLTLQADFMMITNGHSDFWYKKESKTVSAMQNHRLSYAEPPINSGPRKAHTGSTADFLDSDLPDELSECASAFLNFSLQ